MEYNEAYFEACGKPELQLRITTTSRRRMGEPPTPTLTMKKQRSLCSSPGARIPGLAPGARPGGGAWRASGGRLMRVDRPGSARRGDAQSSCGLTTRRMTGEGVRCLKGKRQDRIKRIEPRQWKLTLGTWNVTSLAWNEPELVKEIKRSSSSQPSSPSLDIGLSLQVPFFSVLC